MMRILDDNTYIAIHHGDEKVLFKKSSVIAVGLQKDMTENMGESCYYDYSSQYSVVVSLSSGGMNYDIPCKDKGEAEKIFCELNRKWAGSIHPFQRKCKNFCRRKNNG